MAHWRSTARGRAELPGKRRRTDLITGKTTVKTVYAVTSLIAEQATLAPRS
ncbi:hypothetical protein [Streptomyces sp. NPDC005859]|uniref:hypothetical protein n=1 Tax=Streptomyces sp. NPDC005859 TaxID=3157170 RepID=UPI003407E60F